MKKKILVVEDQKIVREMFAEMFRSLLPELEIVWAESAEQAIGMITIRPAFDLVMTDLDCPDPKSGIGVVEAAKKCEINTPVIMMTGSMDQAGIERFAECKGADAGLAKPADIRVTYSLINNLLNPFKTAAS